MWCTYPFYSTFLQNDVNPHCLSGPAPHRRRPPRRSTAASSRCECSISTTSSPRPMCAEVSVIMCYYLRLVTARVHKCPSLCHRCTRKDIILYIGSWKIKKHKNNLWKKKKCWFRTWESGLYIIRIHTPTHPHIMCIGRKTNNYY